MEGKPITPKIAFATLVALGLLLTTIPVTPAEDSAAAEEAPPNDPISPECRTALDEVRQYVSDNREWLRLGVAAAYLVAHAGDVCRFEEAGAVNTEIEGNEPSPTAQHQSPVTQRVEVVERTFYCLDQECVPEEPAVPATMDTTVPSGRIVDCNVPADGIGEISGKILGITLKDEPADGQWESAGGSTFVEVTGEGPTLGGTQLAQLGQMRFLKAVQLPANDGSSGAKCYEAIDTSVQGDRQCTTVWVFFIYYQKCIEKITTTTTITLFPCGASAGQALTLGGLGVISIDHSYSVPKYAPICNGATGLVLPQFVGVPEPDVNLVPGGTPATGGLLNG